MIRTDEYNAPSITMMLVLCNLWFVLKHLKCKQYFIFSQFSLSIFKHFGCKCKELKHIKLQNQNVTGLSLSCIALFQLNTTLPIAVTHCSQSQQDIKFLSMELNIKLGTARLMLNHYFSLAKFFNLKFLPLVNYPNMGRFFVKINSPKTGKKWGIEEIKVDLKAKAKWFCTSYQV